MIWLRQSTASQEVPLGYFLDNVDGDTAETGLTIANTDIKLWKAGATTLANKNSGGATHIAGGVYYAVLDATDTDTVGSLVLFVHVSGALTVRLECVVVAANVYDSVIAGSDALQVHANEITAGLITAAAIATGAIDADALAADAGAELADAVWDEARAGHVGAGSFGEGMASVQGNVTGSVGSVTGAVGSVTGAVGSVTAGVTVAAAGAGLTAVPWNAAWDAEVQSEVEDALDVMIADSVPADGSRPSSRQALYMIVQYLLERSVSGTTVTVRKPDGSTALMTLTLSDAASPTSITRTT